ncbi:ATP synthase F(0) complex subunit C2, mitochondrial-like [Hemiscyllium ocellatum]|uniref:ATP synthase F(0) complex subunit C2, mitochondrial-like n=1 Tax=Hemiscyllium ocellatum TaxID=170820 RepID=UPI0029673D1C|nr:ATP synthase F(0) complex subunit C2, mitochondrial-like [Hemiscyllium ocellatum]
MYACGKFVSSPAVVHSTLRTFLGRISNSVLSRPEIRNEQAQLFPTSGNTPVLNSRTSRSVSPPGISILLLLIGISAATGGMADPGAGIGMVFDIIGNVRNPSVKWQLFFYAVLGFALSKVMGPFCLMIAFLPLFAM